MEEEFTMNEKQKVYVVVGTLKCSDITNNIAAFSTQEAAEKFMASDHKQLSLFTKESLFIDIFFCSSGEHFIENFKKEQIKSNNIIKGILLILLLLLFISFSFFILLFRITSKLLSNTG
jgi:hypothetical protein